MPAPDAAIEPPKPSSVSVEIASLDHPVVEEMRSSVQGEVVAVTVSRSRDVTTGEQLFSIRYKRPGSSKAAALVKRIAELEALVKQDPTERKASVVIDENGAVEVEDPTKYEALLARARRDLRRTQQQADVSAVKASAAGLVESRVKVGDEVKVGTTLGVRLDGRTWLAIAIVQGAKPAANWSCIVAAPDDSHTSVCKILTTEAIEGDAGTRVTVEMSASGAAWLKNRDQHPRLILDPPSVR